jgi:Peptidase family M28
MRPRVRPLLLFAALSLCAAPRLFSPPPEVYKALETISPDVMRGNLSFIASDLLEGRDTPSRGLDIAAEYIAAQFRAAGLEPAGDDGYFQTAKMLRAAPAGDSLRIQDGSRVLAVSAGEVTVLSSRPLHLAAAPIHKIRDLAALHAPDAKQELTGKVVAIVPGKDRAAMLQAVASLEPAAILLTAEWDEESTPRLIDPADYRDGIPRLIVHGGDALAALREAKAGQTRLSVSIDLAAPASIPVTVRNVIGLLRGSDPALRDQYILVTAHYDHVGEQGPSAIFHGANDDGSGTVSVIEIGRALAGLPVHPLRSIVLMTFFGEEEGSLGARYYASHPVFPMTRTVADLNLEQVGRTDSSAGPEISNASLTGFDFSDISRTLQQAGELTGVKVYRTPNGDDYFDRSDNQVFAEHGVPAHTIVVAFEYPDYHAVGDVWQKIDYNNMAKVDRMIALGAIMLADNPDAPQWNRQNRKAARYAQAR